VVMKREITRQEGPFKFSYMVTYRAEEGDETWKLVSFERNGFVPVKPYDKLRQRELVEKHGPRACAVAHALAEREEKIPENIFKAAQLQFV
ncbi:MAG: hypothetical protein Q8P08_00795, partial [bacterium]|nr:hypothetical protein [bacterium]